MILSIKNEATERLAREVAKEAGESLTEAIQKSLEERWERLKRRRKGHILAGQVEDLLRRVGGRGVSGYRCGAGLRASLTGSADDLPNSRVSGCHGQRPRSSLRILVPNR